MNEHRVHQIFEISVVLKAAHAAIECLGGLLLAFVSNESIHRLVGQLTQHEIVRDPHDLVAGALISLVQSLSLSTQNFDAFYLLSHGVVKMLLAIGLLRGKLWAYPASLVALGLFMVYQIYRYTYTHSAGLIVLTVFDVLVVILVWHEYRVVRQHRIAR